jgi:hypothetical protein
MLSFASASQRVAMRPQEGSRRPLGGRVHTALEQTIAQRPWTREALATYQGGRICVQSVRRVFPHRDRSGVEGIARILRRKLQKKRRRPKLAFRAISEQRSISVVFETKRTSYKQPGWATSKMPRDGQDVRAILSRQFAVLRPRASTAAIGTARFPPRRKCSAR